MTTAPSFTGLQSTSEAQSRAKRSNRARNTSVERKLRGALWRLGGRYRVCPKGILGRPDIVFLKARVAVFCDGDFWHGRNWARRQERLARGANAAYWQAKIGYNISRDESITRLLSQDGWIVLRYWESDINAGPALIARNILDTLAKNHVKS